MTILDYIILADHVLTMDEEGDGAPITDGAVAVKGEVVVDVGPREKIQKKYSAVRTLPGEGKAAIPGLINAHTHAAMSLLRGIADDLPLKEWLEGHIWPAENRWLGPEFVRDGAELACLEMLKAGVTTFSDMYFFESVTAEVVKRFGMKAVLGAGILDFPTKTTAGADDCLKKGEEFIREWQGDGNIRPCIAPHAPYTCSPETLRRAGELAVKYDVIVHTHLSETEREVKDIVARYGKRPVALLKDVGLLNERLLAAHCVWLDDDEIAMLAEGGVKASHCPESNMKLASGIAPVGKMLRAGIKVALGTDGAASNNDLDIMGEMSTASRLDKAASGDPTALDARTALMMATAWGAEALGLKDTGKLKAGLKADVVVVNMRKPHLTPLYNVFSHLVYAARSSDVEAVMVNGRLVVEGGRLLAVDEDEILSKARRWGERIIGR